MQSFDPTTGQTNKDVIDETLKDDGQLPISASESIQVSDDIPSDTCMSISFNDKASNLDISLSMHDYFGYSERVPSLFRNQSQQTSSFSNCHASTTTQENVSSKSTACTQTTNNVPKTVCIQSDRPALVYEDIKDENHKVMFYTGIPNNIIFDAIFDEIEEDFKSHSTGRPRSLRLIDEFLMVLMRLRLGLLLEDLADRFKIGTSTCSDIFNKWIDYLDVQLQFLVQWISRDCVNATMPESFKLKYPKCRVVIDCTEIHAETPSSLQLRSIMYSDYKSHMTYKSLVGISPAGVVTFVSDLYAGSVSDKQITNLSGLVDLCEVGDAIMADKGFLISDLTTPKGIGLIIPPFKRKNKQLSKREVHDTRKIANLRIHVERQMERIKNFRILQGNMPLTMSGQASKIWKICARLTNLQPPLVIC